MVELNYVEQLSHESVRQVLKKRTTTLEARVLGDSAKITVVQDNLNIHSPASLYKAFEPAEAQRILRRLEFCHTPKHGSWLNMAEIELSVLSRQCLARRLPDFSTLKTEVEP